MKIEPQEFSSIYDEFAPRIFTFCYFRVNSKEDAEDLASKVFIKAWNYISAGNKVDNMKAFLYRTASNSIIDFYRTSKHRKEIPTDDPLKIVDIPEEASFVAAIDHQFAVGEIRKVLDRLPEHYKDVVVLRYINDLTVPEIARTMEITENNVSVRLHRAIDKLREITKKA